MLDKDELSQGVLDGLDLDKDDPRRDYPRNITHNGEPEELNDDLASEIKRPINPPITRGSPYIF